MIQLFSYVCLLFVFIIGGGYWVINGFLLFLFYVDWHDNVESLVWVVLVVSSYGRNL